MGNTVAIKKENKTVEISLLTKRDTAISIVIIGGMDFLMDWRLIGCLRNGLPLDIDVYDATAWSAIGPLSEKSVKNRSNSVDIPDFTSGSWKTNLPVDVTMAKGGYTKVVRI